MVGFLVAVRSRLWYRELRAGGAGEQVTTAACHVAMATTAPTVLLIFLLPLWL